MANNIDLACANASNAAPLVKAGKVRAVAGGRSSDPGAAAAGRTHSGRAGLPNFTSNSEFIYFAAGGTPRRSCRADAAFVAVLKEPAVRKVVDRAGDGGGGTHAAEAAASIRSEKKYAEVLKYSGAKVD